MNADQDDLKAEPAAGAPDGSEVTPVQDPAGQNDIDLALLEESLSKTPWERMQANDDALRLVDMLQAAMEKRRAKLK